MLLKIELVGQKNITSYHHCLEISLFIFMLFCHHQLLWVWPDRAYFNKFEFFKNNNNIKYKTQHTKLYASRWIEIISTELVLFFSGIAHIKNRLIHKFQPQTCFEQLKFTSPSVNIVFFSSSKLSSFFFKFAWNDISQSMFRNHSSAIVPFVVFRLNAIQWLIFINDIKHIIMLNSGSCIRACNSSESLIRLHMFSVTFLANMTAPCSLSVIWNPTYFIK